MKKIMSLMLGLSLILGTAAAFAEDKPADSTKSTKKSKKKSTTKKKTATPATEKKS